MADLIAIGGAKHPVIERVCALARPMVEGHGLLLVGAELAQEGRHKVLWIYIDRPGSEEGKSGGVTIEDCAQVSPEISAALDVEDPLSEAYELRVSSPGLDRPLMSDADFRRFSGRDVQLQLSTAIEGRKKITGRIGEVEGDHVQIITQEGEITVNFSAIHKARLRFDVIIGKYQR